MEDFNSYARKNSRTTSDKKAENPSMKLGDINFNDPLSLVKSVAEKFDGKDTNDLLKAIYAEAKKGKKNGTLKNQDIDNFVAMLSPLLDDKKRKYLARVAEDLKKI